MSEITIYNSIDKLGAGPEMNVWIAEKVFGYVWRKTECNDEQYALVPPDWSIFSVDYWLGQPVNYLVPDYSTSLYAAWEIVLKVASGMIQFRLETTRSGCLYAKFIDCESGDIYGSMVLSKEQAPLAICRAALRVVMIPEAELSTLGVE